MRPKDPGVSLYRLGQPDLEHQQGYGDREYPIAEERNPIEFNASVRPTFHRVVHPKTSLCVWRRFAAILQHPFLAVGW